MLPERAVQWSRPRLPSRLLAVLSRLGQGPAEWANRQGIGVLLLRSFTSYQAGRDVQ